MYTLFVKLSGSTIEILHIMILHFSNINLLCSAVSKFYMKPISSFYREQELTSKQLKTMSRPHHINSKLRPIATDTLYMESGGWRSLIDILTIWFREVVFWNVLNTDTHTL